MSSQDYAPVPGGENEKDSRTTYQPRRNFTITPTSMCISLCLLALTLIAFTVGMRVGQTWESYHHDHQRDRGDGLLDPQTFIGSIPKKDVMFKFPSGYESSAPGTEQMWDELMPLGAGFIRVPHPRKYAMPRSKKIENDPEDAELYSVSMTHQLHCLAVLRNVIIYYEKGSKSRFAGEGHEYHCIDYLRQAVLCAGDTTLDHAEIEFNPDGSERRYGFNGGNATHRCRDWGAIQKVLIEKRFDDKTGILF